MARRNGGFIGTDGLDAPDPPTGVAVSGGVDGVASISFTAPTDTGTSAITGFVATASNGIGATGSSSPISVSSLTLGTAVTFRAYAVNAYGTSAASDATGVQHAPAGAVHHPGLVREHGGPRLAARGPARCARRPPGRHLPRLHPVRRHLRGPLPARDGADRQPPDRLRERARGRGTAADPGRRER